MDAADRKTWRGRLRVCAGPVTRRGMIVADETADTM